MVVKEIVSDEKDKPILNEEILGKLLEAAYVLQEHNRALQKVELNLELQSEQLRERQQAQRIAAPPPRTPDAENEPPPAVNSNSEDYTFTLAQIVETQNQIQLRQLDLESAMTLVIERLIDITKASGAAVGVLDGKIVRYRAGVGLASLPHGSEVEKERALCFGCLHTGQVFRCADVSSEFLLDVEECRRRGIQSLIAVPVYHDGGIAGALELYFANAQSFREPDVHSCQLMAGLVTEALARDEEMTWKKSLAAERSAMLEALEKIKPNLVALVGDAEASGLGAKTPTDPASAETYIRGCCDSCGEELVAGEQYCGKCGSPRASEEQPQSMQSKLASLWSAQHPETEKEKEGGTTVSDDQEEARLSESELVSTFTAQVTKTDAAATISSSRLEEAENAARSTGSQVPESQIEEQETETASVTTALTTTEDHLTWSSAAKARDFLEQLAASRTDSAFARFWNARRGDVYLAVAVILVAVVIRWGIWSDHSVSATGTPTVSARAHRRQPAPDADLSLFDKMLIGMGLAEPPEAPENKGNPDTQVWVDLHTALYYCPGADLYGKTPKGRYTSQRDAQLDQFEPAYRKACE